jgi:hypothetical protein
VHARAQNLNLHCRFARRVAARIHRDGFSGPVRVRFPGGLRKQRACGHRPFSIRQDEYLQFHFAKPEELAPLVGKFVSKEALNFPALVAKEVSCRAPRARSLLDCAEPQHQDHVRLPTPCVGGRCFECGLP